MTQKRIKAKDRIGQKFGMLIVIDAFRLNNITTVKVLCECGVEKTMQLSHLTSGIISSCGCKRDMDTIERNKKREKILKDGIEMTLAEYNNFHAYIYNHYGKATKCENPLCKSGNPKRYEYALIKGRTYSKNIYDYIQLCPSCHRKYDYNPESGVKQSLSTKGVLKPEQWIPIIQYGFRGKFIKKHLSISRASEATGLLRTSICNALNGRAKRSGGFIWKYENKISNEN